MKQNFGIGFFMIWLLGYGSFFCSSCSSDNLGRDHEVISDDELAVDYMNQGEYELAIDILESLIVDEPEVYKRYTLLAAAYAAFAGVDMVALLKSFVTSGTSGGGSVFTLILNFIPEDEDGIGSNLMKNSVNTLLEIPGALVGDDGDPEFGKSAELQLILYQTVYATMLLNLAVGFDEDGNIDLDSLKDLTVDEAIEIIRALRGASSASNSEESAAIGSKIDDTLSEIDSAEGEDEREQLADYLSNL